MSYYGYERLRPGDALGIDMAAVTEQFGKDLNAYKKKKDDEVTDVAEANRGFAESLAKMPSSFNDNWNTFFGDTSNNAMKGATQVTDDFNKGVIDKRTFDIRMANLNSSVSMTVESMTKIAAEINKFEELSAAGKMNPEDQYKWSQYQKFADLGNVSMVFDPEAYTSTLIKVNPPDIAKGISSSYEMMNINQFYNGVNMTPGPMYDTNTAITNTLNSLGGVRDITTADGKRRAGIILEGAEGDEVVADLSQAMLGQSRDMRLFAMDNTITDAEGKVADFDYARLPMDVYDTGGSINQEKFKKLQTDNPYLFYEDQSGRFYESDKARELILKNAGEMLRGAADFTAVDKPPVKTANDMGKAYDRFRLGLELVNRAGKKIPDNLLKLALTVPGMDAETAEKLFGDLTFEDKDTRTTTQEKDDLEKIRNRKIATASDKWYESVFLREAVIAEDDEGFSIDKINEFLLDTPYTVDDDTREVKFGDETIYTFDKENWLNNDVRASDIKNFKRKLKAFLDTQQEVLLYFSENPDMMTKDWDSDTTETKTDKYNKNR